MTTKQIGILALQGAFESHRQKITSLGGSALLVKTESDLSAVSGLILPGGESSTMLKLLTPGMRTALTTFCKSGAPLLATCAGTILLAQSVSNPKQDSLCILDVDIVRNGYGRQVDSFVTPSITLTDRGKELLDVELLEGVFIRAPIISRVESGIEVLAYEEENPVLVQAGNIVAATFHPELSDGESPLHRYFLSLV
jgi:5'-phosphate synthase pdxT subunit